MIKYLVIHAVSTIVLFTLWIANLGLPGDEVGMAPYGLAIILLILSSAGILLSLIFRNRLKDRVSISIGLIISIFVYQMFVINTGKESWIALLMDSDSAGMIHRAYVFPPLITGFLIWVIIYFIEPKRIGSNQ